MLPRSIALMLVAVVAAGCGRAPVVAAPSVVTDPSPTSARVPEVEPLAGRPLILPTTKRGERAEATPGPSQDLEPAEPPGPAHPAGTVYRSQPGDSADEPIRVTEWDLATGAMLHGMTIPLPHDPSTNPAANSHVLRVGDHAELMVWAFNEDVYFVRIRPDWSGQSVDRIGRVSAHGPSAFVSDGKETLVLFPGVLDDPEVDRRSNQDPSGVVAAVYASDGKRIIRALLEQDGPRNDSPSEGMDDNAVVHGGRIYTLQLDGTETSWLYERSLDLGIVKRIAIHERDIQSGGATLGIVLDHLVVTTPTNPGAEGLAVSFDLTKQGPATPLQFGWDVKPFSFAGGTDCSRAFSMGQVHAAVCDCHGKLCVAWKNESP